jgi:PHD/YefM family antitoxin component YafN of YafNO toxin-antitoxin module
VIGGVVMITLSVTNFRKNIYNILSQTIKFNEPININTKEGNAVILSEEDYNGLIETLNLSTISNLKESIIEGLNTSIDDCISEEEVEW